MDGMSGDRLNPCAARARVGINRFARLLSVHGFECSQFKVRVDGVEQAEPLHLGRVGDILNEHTLSRIEIQILEDNGLALAETPWVEVFFDRGLDRAATALLVGVGVLIITAAILMGYFAGAHAGGSTATKLGLGIVCSLVAAPALFVLLLASIGELYAYREKLADSRRHHRRARFLKKARNLSEQVKGAIETGDVLVGMTKEQVQASIGSPKRIDCKRTATADLVLWEYQWLWLKVGNQLRRYDFVYFEGNAVCSAHWAGGSVGQPPPSLPRLPDAPSSRILKQI